MAGIKDIAKKTGLSLATISRVFNDSNLVSNKTKAKVLSVAKELDYQPNLMAAALRSGKSKIIGVIVPEINNPFFSAIINGIELRASKLGYNIIIAQSHESSQKENRAIQSLLKLNVEGILISVSKQTDYLPILAKLKSNKVPMVFFDRTPLENDIDQVILDDYKGAYIATEHLINQNCKNLLHIVGDLEVSIHQRRKDGFKDALAKNGIPISKQRFLSLEMDVNQDTSKIRLLLQSKLPVDGVFVHGDETCLYVLNILKDLKIKVPKKVKLVGFGNTKFSMLSHPKLSTIDQGCIEMGTYASEILIGQLKSKTPLPTQKKILPPKLIIRESSAT
ncbi:LacI family DNA-binding transcriptional regulator [Croceitalea sp. MTPC9]|uniref:LacI family DNA-binding transcriptional regulator n=1 Tax=unclassified Croceitalea TaxID=2632280 RepID=UPI002B3D0200|nr:LacI family DNA-binding transcriptional regulator [Croceitalea sp. MTPC6]GMN16992.1 LacI family DNA-binding transcriptional regulator [Croceitalea sp. MTPC9]